MSVRTCQQNRRSSSIFSLDHIRSLSKRGFRREEQLNSPDVSFRSRSSLSCNPHHQPPAEPQPVAAVSHVIVEGFIDSSNALNTSSQHKSVLSHFRELSSHKKHYTKPRPLSWFSNPRSSLRNHPKRSLSVQMARGKKSSVTARSVISAPVLTGTTNADVAEAEGVCRRNIEDIVLPAPSDTVINSQNKLMDVPAHHAQPNVPGILGRLYTRTTGKEKAKNDVQDTAPPSDSGHGSVDTSRLSAFEKGLARRRAETINLCRQKINQLTGSGHIKRKSIEKGPSEVVDTGEETGNNDIVKQSEQTKANTKSSDLLSSNDGSSDIAPGSLTRSFASAVNQLNSHLLQPPSKMNLPKSRSSIFNLRKQKKSNEKHNTDEKSTENTYPVGSEQELAIEEDVVDRKAAGLTMSEALEQIQPPQRASRSATSGTPAEPQQFSATANDYVPAQPAAAYPGGVMAMGMHSNTMDFATAPSWVTDLPKPPTHTPTLEEVLPVDEDDEHAIQDAPIFSPSLGDLSQYARPTPTSAQSHTKAEQKSETETPSHAQAEKRYRRLLGLRKSKSGLGLLSIFNKEHSETKEQDQSPQKRDTNRKMATLQQLRKSRSMNPAALLRKTDVSTMKEPLLNEDRQTSSQPLKPSPLRHETQVEDGHVKEPLDSNSVQKRSPPKGNVTPSDRAKRMGFVGMSGESLEQHLKEE